MAFLDDLLSFGSKVGLYVLFMVVLIAVVRILQRLFPQDSLKRSNPLHRLIDCFVHKRESVAQEAQAHPTADAAPKVEESRFVRGLLLAGSAIGLQAAYLTWGVLQEALMTHDYDGERFTSSQFLVFSNRALALCLAIGILCVVKSPPFIAPTYQFCYASFSNVMSSFCQYEVRDVSASVRERVSLVLVVLVVLVSLVGRQWQCALLRFRFAW
jgi:hypothetical protein